MTVARASHVTPEQVAFDIQSNVGKFVPDPNIALGDTDSAHQVLFGHLEGIGQVAVKPFTKVGRAEGERSRLEAVAERGFDAIEPIDVVRGGLSAYLISERRPGLTHLGQVDWSANIATPRLHNVLTPTIHDVASQMASLNNAGITHGDLQAKNVARTREGQPVYVDAERTQIDPTPEALTLHGNKDLRLFGTSVLARGLLQDRSATYRVGYLDAHLIDPYLEAVDPRRFTLSPEERRAAILDHWLSVIKRDTRPRWLQRQLANEQLSKEKVTTDAA